MKQKLLIKNAFVVTCDPALGDFESGDILIEGDHIVRVGPPQPDAPEAEAFDASGMIAIPGLINAHLHTWQAGLRGIGADWETSDYLRHIHHGAATVTTAMDNYYACLVGALAQIDAGVTTIFDWCHNIRDAEMADASIDGLTESGIRAVFGHAIAKPPEKPGERPYWETPHPEDEVRRLRTGRLASDDGLVRLALAILGPDLSTYEVTRHDILLAREYGLITSAHTWGRPGRRKTPDGMWRLNAEGLLGPDHNIAHGNALGDDEMRMILDAGCTFTATPISEMLSNPAPPVLGRVEDYGGVVSVGADTYPHYNGSLLGALRYSFLHLREQDNRARAAKASASPGRHRTTTRKALEWVTVKAARSLMMGEVIGSLSPRKKADVTLIRTNTLSLFPSMPGSGPASIVVMSCEAADVDSVIINGRFAKCHGRLCFSEDKLQRAREALLASRLRLLNHAQSKTGVA